MERMPWRKGGVSVLTGLWIAFWGHIDWLFVLFVLCLCMDYASGTVVACLQGRWSSAIARAGIGHKLGCLTTVLVSAVADLLLERLSQEVLTDTVTLQGRAILCPVVMMWYVVTELGSILENAAALGAPIPSWLARMLACTRTAVERAGQAAAGAPAHEQTTPYPAIGDLQARTDGVSCAREEEVQSEAAVHKAVSEVPITPPHHKEEDKT